MTRTTKLKRAALFAVAVLALAVGGCDSGKNPYDPDKPLDKMTNEEWCNFYSFYLTKPYLSAATRQSATKQMRDRNCPHHA